MCSISEAAKQFSVRGVDTVIARKVCGERKFCVDNDSTYYCYFDADYTPGSPPSRWNLRSDSRFFEDIERLYKNALKSDSHGACQKFAAMFVEYMYTIKSDDSFHKLMKQTPELWADMLRETMMGKVRIMCRRCHIVEHVDKDKLNALGSPQSPGSAMKRKRDEASNEFLSEERLKQCAECETINPTMGWVRQW